MFLLWKGWFLTEAPYDCFYLPFFLVSGPAYLVAHVVQHACEQFFSPDQVMLAWNVVPGMVCLVLGGLQWWCVGRVLVGLDSVGRWIAAERYIAGPSRPGSVDL